MPRLRWQPPSFLLRRPSPPIVIPWRLRLLLPRSPPLLIGHDPSPGSFPLLTIDVSMTPSVYLGWFTSTQVRLMTRIQQTSSPAWRSSSRITPPLASVTLVGACLRLVLSAL
jgi:hypothetical protein